MRILGYEKQWARATKPPPANTSAHRPAAPRRPLPGAAALCVLLLILTTASGCSIASAPTPPPSPTPTLTPCDRAFELPNPIAAENSCAGTTSWQADHPSGSDDAIEGYTAPSVVDPGGVVQLYVSTTALTYTFAVYRLGYYSGAGARLMYTSPTATGSVQPAATLDPTTRTVSAANWTQPTAIHIPKTWITGVYLIKLVSSDGYMRYTFFVLRNTTSQAPLLVALPLLTYQAYNMWGNYDLYRGLASDGSYTFAERSYAVSFDRPYESGAGLAELAVYDAPLINWLERSAYNVTYDADFDLGTAGPALQQHKVIMVSGHAEYWSTAMRTAVTAARDAGTSLAFMGANDLYWHVRLQASALGTDRIVVCYKDATLDPLAPTQPAAATVRWRDAPLNQPEAAVLGEMYHGALAGSAPLVLDQGSQQFLAGTALQPGSSLPGLVYGEFDRIAPGLEPAPLTVIASSPLTCIPTSLCPPPYTDTANATIYTARSGAKVFDAGTFVWSWGLSDLRIEPPSPTIVGESPRTATAPAGTPVIPSALPVTSEVPQAQSRAAAEQVANADFQQMTANILAYLQG